MKSDTVLVADDEQSVRQVIAAVLEEEGFSVLQAANGTDCLRMYVDKRPDLVLLDILMPGKDGRETCKQLREFSDVPIIMLTALTESNEKVDRLNQGADDYVSKPFDNHELVARIRTVLRRAGRTTDRKYNDRVLNANFETQEIYLNNRPLQLSPMDWRLLELLIKHKNRFVPLKTIRRHLWGYREDDDDGYKIKIAVCHLRRALGDPGRHPRYILSGRRQGYKFQGYD